MASGLHHPAWLQRWLTSCVAQVPPLAQPHWQQALEQAPAPLDGGVAFALRFAEAACVRARAMIPQHPALCAPHVVEALLAFQHEPSADPRQLSAAVTAATALWRGAYRVAGVEDLATLRLLHWVVGALQYP